MSQYIGYDDMIAFHPGYYIEELVKESDMSLKDFAKTLGIAPEHLDALINGEQDLSMKTATKLSGMLGTTVTFWLNLQNTYNQRLSVNL